MIPARFDYEVAEGVDHAIELLGSREDAKLLAGGHSLIPLLRLRVTRPALLVDIGRLAELAYVRDVGDHVAIGALTRLEDVRHDELLGEHCRIVSETAAMIGDPQVRHRGTIGGSLAHGDPASDLPAVLAAVGAELVVRGSGGERVVPAASFFTGVFQTALAADDVLTEVRVPKLVGATGSAYLKYRRRAQDWATVGVAAVVQRDGGSITDAAVGLTNMGGVAVRAAATEGALKGGASVADAAALAAEGTEPPSDQAGSAEYRRHLARVLTARALEQAVAG